MIEAIGVVAGTLAILRWGWEVWSWWKKRRDGSALLRYYKRGGLDRPIRTV